MFIHTGSLAAASHPRTPPLAVFTAPPLILRLDTRSGRRMLSKQSFETFVWSRDSVVHGPQNPEQRRSDPRTHHPGGRAPVPGARLRRHLAAARHVAGRREPWRSELPFRRQGRAVRSDAGAPLRLPACRPAGPARRLTGRMPYALLRSTADRAVQARAGTGTRGRRGLRFPAPARSRLHRSFAGAAETARRTLRPDHRALQGGLCRRAAAVVPPGTVL